MLDIRSSSLPTASRPGRKLTQLRRVFRMRSNIARSTMPRNTFLVGKSRIRRNRKRGHRMRSVNVVRTAIREIASNPDLNTITTFRRSSRRRRRLLSRRITRRLHQTKTRQKRRYSTTNSPSSITSSAISTSGSFTSSLTSVAN
jgi:hypothetical protein